MGRLASRNLLRGYRLSLPTGQAVSMACGLPALDAATLISAVVPTRRAQFVAAGFDRRTPLWFYLLAEAGDPGGPNGLHLGPVGSRVVAEVLHALVEFSPDSVIRTPPSQRELASEEFTLRGLIRLGLDRNLPAI
jgi:hypothetical protein